MEDTANQSAGKQSYSTVLHPTFPSCCARMSHASCGHCIFHGMVNRIKQLCNDFFLWHTMRTSILFLKLYTNSTKDSCEKIQVARGIFVWYITRQRCITIMYWRYIVSIFKLVLVLKPPELPLPSLHLPIPHCPATFSSLLHNC